MVGPGLVTSTGVGSFSWSRAAVCVVTLASPRLVVLIVLGPVSSVGPELVLTLGPFAQHGGCGQTVPPSLL